MKTAATETVHYDPGTLRQAIEGLVAAGSLVEGEAQSMRSYVDTLEAAHQEVCLITPDLLSLNCSLHYSHNRAHSDTHSHIVTHSEANRILTASWSCRDGAAA